jgi:hypothetical protein
VKRKLIIIVQGVLIVLIAGAGSVGNAGAAPYGPSDRSPSGTEVKGSPHSPAIIPAGSGFTYQGKLKEGANPANGQYDFQFALYDAATGGSQVGPLLTLANQTVTDGLFTVTLDFGAAAFNGESRWLEISVRHTGGTRYSILAPRQPLTAAPYSMSLVPGAVISGTTTTGPSLVSANNYGSGTGVTGQSNSGYGGAFGSTSGTALFALGGTTGVNGQGNTTGVYGLGLTSGVQGVSDAGQGVSGSSTSGIGVRGTSSTNVGVWGESSDESGVQGLSTNDFGVYGESSTTYGVAGYSTNGGGVSGQSWTAGASGVFGRNDTSGSFGVTGWSTNGTGVSAISTNGTAVRGTSTNGMAIYGASTNGMAIQGVSSVSNGVQGNSDSSSASGVYGQNTGGGYGVAGYSSTGTGIWGRSDSNIGVLGSSATSLGMEGISSTDTGVWGRSTSGKGVDGMSDSNTGVIGRSSSGYGGYFISGSADGLYAAGGPSARAAYFNGNVRITGACCGMAEGTTQIDDPLDPANKYLNQSFVQSPEMLDIYRGHVTTGPTGEAVVTMPAWFQATNRDFDYQLTVIGQFAQAIVATELKDNTFTIRTDKPNVKVSWQVTGTRNDPYAQQHPISNEQDKPAGEKGYYLHPELYGKGPDRSVDPNVRNPQPTSSAPVAPVPASGPGK